ncbi:hypothetical protein ABIB15_002951 [Marisediminicola sp. UYEF4]|uniref:hypothetical protein n=1 Tax=Marisediminicola sp. UYEF4 TaxID=1756384 RepID=UPI003399C82A
MEKDLVDLFGDLNLIAGCGSGQKVLRSGSFSPGRFMRREEIVDSGYSGGVVADVCLLVQRGAHTHSYSKET